MTLPYDALESRPAPQRERALMAALPRLIAHAKATTPYYTRALADVDPAAVKTRAALAALPLTRKSALIDLQAGEPPFGGLVPRGAVLGRILQSPGPIYDPEGARPDTWRMARALFAAGVRGGDLVHNTFSYHFTPGGWIFDDGARALGCRVFPAGTGQTEQQIQAMTALRPGVYTGTPSFLAILLDKADQAGADVSSLRVGLVSGEAYLPAQRAAFKARGIMVSQCYCTADLGLIAYEAPDAEGNALGMILDEGLILEIVRPGTGDPVAPGEVGEVVITTFTPEYPLIRFATGDLSAVLTEVPPDERTNVRLKGWMGRADQTTKVKGMFVHPEQVAEVTRRHPELLRARLVVSREGEAGPDLMTLICETNDGTGPAEAVGETTRALTKLRATIAFTRPGTLPNDGKVIEDTRAVPG
ncbi:phenylacetate--CoA ligase family protein [Pararhodospirillum oryzae]|uniref:Phenylacetate--CoA ligase n=1 Tax=Pararhodospirillum oryzae TaxID=478448 RepID=A0A512HAG4_9PROT|nr:AMP-binding protein [Pararhodospirillum oryzae]GEO82444.1 phenylacetate--CoA ligase [Pararhodospirillum oryzae]